MPSLFQAELRQFLKTQGVLADPAPVSASVDDVAKFCDDNVGGPTRDQPVLMDWTNPLSSKWNKEAIFVLAGTFHQLLREGAISTVAYNENEMTRSVIADMCAQKLTKILSSYNRSHRMNTDQLEEAAVERARMNRVTTRRHGVCALILHSRFSTYRHLRPKLAVGTSSIAITRGTQTFGIPLRFF